MNTRVDVEEHLEMDSLLQTAGTETDMLAQCGWSAEEIVALLWLRQWYQTGAVIAYRSCATWSSSSSLCCMTSWKCKQGT